MAKIEADGHALTFVLTVKGKGKLKFGPVTTADLQSQLARETEFRDQQDPNMDPHRAILNVTREKRDGSTTTLSVGWVDGQFSDLAISTWPNRVSLHCAGFDPIH